MIVSDEDDAYSGDPRPIYGTVFTNWRNFGCGLKREPSATVQPNRKLPRAISCERMRLPRYQFSDICCGFQVSQTTAKQPGTRDSELPFLEPFALAKLLQFAAEEGYLHITAIAKLRIPTG